MRQNKTTYLAKTLQNHSQTSVYVQRPNLGPNSEWWTYPGSSYRWQVTAALHIKFDHFICNSDLYQRTNEIRLTWKTDGNSLVTSFASIHKYQVGSQSDIISITASEHFSFSQRYSIQQFQSLRDLDRLIELGYDRKL